MTTIVALFLTVLSDPEYQANKLELLHPAKMSRLPKA